MHKQLFVFGVIAFLALVFSCCGGPDRKSCKKACEKVYDCAHEMIDGYLDDPVWNVSCQNGCAEAKDITSEEASTIDCLIDEPCDEFPLMCDVDLHCWSPVSKGLDDDDLRWIMVQCED